MIVLPPNIAIVGDIHLRHEVVERRLARHKFEQVVFLGDYFDSWDQKLSAKATAQWLEASVKCPDRVHLLGNHDVHYIPGCREEYMCSGYSNSAAGKIQRRFTQFRELKLFYRLGNAYLTHAGIGSSYVARVIAAGAPLEDYLASETEEFLASVPRYSIKPPHWFFNWSSIRGGDYLQGGILTMDVREYRDIAGIYQIFGHTAICPAPFVSEDVICLDNTSGVGFLTTESGGIEVETLV